LIKHISFDLWLTLIKSHPEFKEKRAAFLEREFNPGGFSVREIMEIVQNTDKVSDRLNEITGSKDPTDQMYRRILLQMGNKPQSLSKDLLHQIKLKVHDLFMKFPPGFLNIFIRPMLHIMDNEGYMLNISSNTGFIEGSTIAETLKHLGISEYFVFCIFSDEIGASKPSGAFFDKVFDQVTVGKEEVLHIGDNFKADYEGAINYGFKALHINNQQYTINDIKRYL
jgi:putative hydrolase of the HAD superfamily